MGIGATDGEQLQIFKGLNAHCQLADKTGNTLCFCD
jgi:hypothetical protein